MSIPRDKLLHLGAGAIAALVGVVAGALAGLGLEALLIGFVTCLAAALGREFYNESRGGLFDWYDVAATVAGGSLVLLVAAPILYQ